jgi:peroxiredoxin Q/BCP
LISAARIERIRCRGDGEKRAMPLIKPGKKLPAFTARTADGEVLKGATLTKGFTVIYFYPKDDTPGCTKEACAFRDLHAKLLKAKARVFGVSADSAESHAKFSGKFKLPFDLIVDEPGKDGVPPLTKKLGAWQEKSMYGKTYMGIARITYLVGPGGVVLKRWDKVKPEEHAAEVLQEILQAE